MEVDGTRWQTDIFVHWFAPERGLHDLLALVSSLSKLLAARSHLTLDLE